MSVTPMRRSRMRSAVAGVAAVGLLSLIPIGSADAGVGVIRNADARDAIEDSFIVVYKAPVTTKPNGKVRAENKAHTTRLAKRYGAEVKQPYDFALNGFAGRMSAAQARKLAADPSVAYVQQDQTVSISATQTPTPSWGLDRIDQASLPLNNSYTFPNTGAGVRAYIIDTGIRTTHSDFGGRAIWGANMTGDGLNTDGNGHGTHVAGTVGGASKGIAKGVQLVAVKVLNSAGSGSIAGVISGINWVVKDKTASGRPAVANISLGTLTGNVAVDDAVTNAISKGGVTVVSAAGNNNGDACQISPARVPAAITVGATDSTDRKATFSDYGRCVDLFAPGVAITSDWWLSNTAVNTISGTSMSAPHVTGAAALVLATTPTATPATVATTLITRATPNKVGNLHPSTANRLLLVR